MERMWRKVNHSFGGRISKSSSMAAAASTDTMSSAGGFGDGQVVVAVSGIGNNLPASSSATGRRLAASGQLMLPVADTSGSTSATTTTTAGAAAGVTATSTAKFHKSLSQHVIHNSTASSAERRRRRRRKSRPRRSGVSVSCVGGNGGDNMSSSGGFYTIKEKKTDGSTNGSNHRRRHRQSAQSKQQSSSRLMASSAPSGTVMMYPNPASNRDLASGTAQSTMAETTVTTAAAAATATATPTPDISLRQRAVAKLRMFNFHLNWDLHMTHCKPCGPRISSSGGGGNIITRRFITRCRRREDNELYRSNSFKFERFERKECVEELTDTLKKQIAICDDYSLPVDFVKKRPSSFDPCLAESIPTNIENWALSSPQTEFVHFADSQQQQQQQTLPPQQQQPSQQQPLCPSPPPPPPAPLSTLPTAIAAAAAAGITAQTNTNNTLPNQPIQQSTLITQLKQRQSQHHSIQLKAHNQHHLQHQQQHRLATQLPTQNTIKQASVKLIEGYSDPKDSKRHKKVYHKKGKRRIQKKHQQQQQQQVPPQQKQQTTEQQQQHSSINNSNSLHKDKRSTYSSDSSAPKSSDDEDVDNHSIKVPELNSPDSISDDLIQPLPSQLHRSPRKLTAGPSETSKRNPSPYYYSDLLKSREQNESSNAIDKETKNKSRQSTVSEPPQFTQAVVNVLPYRKSTSLDVPERDEREDYDEEEDEFEETEPTNTTVLLAPPETTKRYSFTEDGVRIIRCDSPTTSTSDESDCSECLKRREWHARALALVRKTCNVQPLIPAAATALDCIPDDSESLSMPPNRLFGPAVCACVAPAIGDDIDEYFRPRSIFYVHPHGVHECADCATDSKNLVTGSRSLIDSSSHAQSADVLNEDDAEREGADCDTDDMSGRTRQIYETAFDCKVAKSDDDLDEVDRITNHSLLLQLNNGNNLPAPRAESRSSSKSGHVRSRLEGKRLKNSKNQAIQEQASSSGGNASGSASPHMTAGTGTNARPTTDLIETSIAGISADLSNVHIHETNAVDQQNNATTTTSTSTSQLPMRGYTPSPPSTAPLPMKFPGKHDRFFMNSIRSAPNLPASNPAHPRLRDLRLPMQSSLRQQQQGSSLGTSNENSLTDSAYVNPPSSHHGHHHHHHHLPSSTSGGDGSGNHKSSRTRDRPRSFVLESGRVLELRKSHASSHHHHHHVVGNGNGRRQHHNYSSTESIATSSSGGSMESLRSSTSEGNRSTSSSESRHSTSLSSHSSESGSSSVAFPLRAPVVIHSKLHILSPISDKSSQEPASEQSDQNKALLNPPEDGMTQQQNNRSHVSNNENIKNAPHLQLDAIKKRRPQPTNKTLLHLADEILGSDSGISLHSREDGKSLNASGLQKFTLPQLNFPSNDKCNNDSGVGGISNSTGLPQDLHELPFDMPKLRRRKTLQQDACTSGSATSVDLGDLPFDMPKLRRRLRTNQNEINNLIVHSTESSGISQASSSHSMRDENKGSLKLDTAIFRQNLTLNLNEPRQANKFGSLDLRGLSTTKELNLNLAQNCTSAVDLIDVSIPLERQGWYHGAITRIEAETTLRPLSEGSFLVRNCESTKQDYSLSLKGAKGFMHMRIQRNDTGQYILGQFSRPFETVPDMIRHFCLNRLPVRGAEHMCLLEPVIAPLL